MKYVRSLVLLFACAALFAQATGGFAVTATPGFIGNQPGIVVAFSTDNLRIAGVLLEISWVQDGVLHQMTELPRFEGRPTQTLFYSVGSVSSVTVVAREIVSFGRSAGSGGATE